MPRKITARSFNQVYWPYLPVILAAGLLTSLFVSQDNFKAVLKNPGDSILSYAGSMEEAQLLNKTNSERASAGLESLKPNEKLDLAAQAKAEDMAVRNYWSHTSPDGEEPWAFVARHNYSYQKLGENLAAGFDSEDSTINGWLASQSHKENLLNPYYSDVGFGITKSSDYSAAGGGPMTIVVAFYGEPSSGGSGQTQVLGDKSPSNVSFGQLALAKLPIAGAATNLIIAVAVGTLVFWFGRHYATLRHALRKGEKFVLRHPLLDIGLLVIIAVSYLLTRTAGLIY